MASASRTVGIIGLGFGRGHIPAFQAHGCQVVAVCQRDQKVAREVAAGRLDPEKVDQKTFARHLYVPEQSNADLVWRTSGEQRLSNFMLWQAAYSEMVFSDVLWPDVPIASYETVPALEGAIAEMDAAAGRVLAARDLGDVIRVELEQLDPQGPDPRLDLGVGRIDDAKRRSNGLMNKSRLRP